MDTRNTTRDEIIKVGLQVFAEKGFNAAGIDAVLKAARVPKGSFYYYFPSKEEFGVAVLDRFAEEAHCYTETFLNDPSRSPLSRLKRYLIDQAEEISKDECQKGCLIGNLSQEMASQHDRFRARLNDIWTGWRHLVAGCLDEAKAHGEITPESDTERLAEFVIMGLEGSIIRAKVMKSPQPVYEFIEVLFDKVLK